LGNLDGVCVGLITPWLHLGSPWFNSILKISGCAVIRLKTAIGIVKPIVYLESFFLMLMASASNLSRQP